MADPVFLRLDLDEHSALVLDILLEDASRNSVHPDDKSVVFKLQSQVQAAMGTFDMTKYVGMRPSEQCRALEAAGVPRPAIARLVGIPAQAVHSNLAYKLKS